jgi:hypothetical protein
LWAHDDEPSNFTTLNFPPSDASNVGAFSQSDLVVLSLKANEGKGLSDSDLEKAVVQGKMPAQNIHQLMDVMEAYMHGSAFFFGEDSYLTQQLLQVWSNITDHRPQYTTCFATDPSFPAQFQYRIDRSVYLYLQSCMHNEDRRKISFAPIDFRTDFSEVARGTFTQALPPCFKQQNLKRPGDDDKKDSGKKEDGSKRRRQDDKDGRTKVLNTHLHGEHKLHDNESWNKHFAGKHLDLIPTNASGKKVCHKFHGQGFCWSDCKKADTHNQESMTPSVATGLTKWMEKCRSAAS